MRLRCPAHSLRGFPAAKPHKSVHEHLKRNRMLALRANCHKATGMRRKRVVASKSQLSLFDIGLDAPAPDAAKSGNVTSSPQSKLLPALRQVPTAPAKLIEVDASALTEPCTPSAFEKASYDLYLKAKTETHISARTTGALVLILLALVFLNVQVAEAGLGFIKIGAVKTHIVIGVTAWLTLLSAKTLIRAAYMIKKKLDCGLFYQMVLQFSDNILVRAILRFFDILFVAIFIAIIMLTLIIAYDEMYDVVKFIIHEVASLSDPWHAKLVKS